MLVSWLAQAVNGRRGDRLVAVAPLCNGPRRLFAVPRGGGVFLGRLGWIVSGGRKRKDINGVRDDVGWLGCGMPCDRWCVLSLSDQKLVSPCWCQRLLLTLHRKGPHFQPRHPCFVPERPPLSGRGAHITGQPSTQTAAVVIRAPTGRLHLPSAFLVAEPGTEPSDTCCAAST